MSEITHFIERLADRLDYYHGALTGQELAEVIRDAAAELSVQPAPGEAPRYEFGRPKINNLGGCTYIREDCADKQAQEAYGRGQADEREAIAKLVETWGLNAFAKCIRQRAQSGEG